MMTRKQRALVTGAAGGIGEDAARRLSRRGYELILVDVDRSGLERLAEDLPGTQIHEVDLSDRSQVSRLLGSIRGSFGPIDVALINAGVITVGEVLDLDELHLDWQLEVNLRSAMQLIKACAHVMADQGSGHILATVSMGGIVALKGSASYSASKFGLRGFLTAIREELKPKGVAVSGIYPSGVDTRMLRHEAENGGSPLNFVSMPQTIESVGRAFERALDNRHLETYVPYRDSISARLVSCFPWMIHHLYPLMAQLGERGRRQFLNSYQQR